MRKGARRTENLSRDGSIREARQANEIAKGTNAAVLDTLARCLAACGDREGALEAARRAAALDPASGEIRAFLEELEAARGR